MRQSCVRTAQTAYSAAASEPDRERPGAPRGIAEAPRQCGFPFRATAPHRSVSWLAYPAASLQTWKLRRRRGQNKTASGVYRDLRARTPKVSSRRLYRAIDGDFVFKLHGTRG